MLCRYISYLYKRLSLRTSSRDSIKKITTIYKRLFTLCSYLKTKESYDRWVTRRVWGFRHQISKAKNLKMSITNIRKLQENTHCIMQNGCEIFATKGQDFRSPRLISQSCKNLPSAWSDLLAMAVTPSFQLRIMHHLKHWIIDFLSFETTHIACIN